MYNRPLIMNFQSGLARLTNRTLPYEQLAIFRFRFRGVLPFHFEGTRAHEFL